MFSVCISNYYLRAHMQINLLKNTFKPKYKKYSSIELILRID